jgi:hypothetical protein
MLYSCPIKLPLPQSAIPMGSGRAADKTLHADGVDSVANIRYTIRW